ncbi:MAG: 3-phosphoshikimate 1-carboxyvinyltransferase [Rhizobiaceae bacterium]
MASPSEPQKKRNREDQGLHNERPVASFPVKDPATQLIAAPQLPGDRLLSCCALLLAGVSDGQSRIGEMSATDEIRKVAAALRELGATVVERDENWLVDGVGNGALLQPERVLDFDHADTAACLMAGLLSSYDFPVEISGISNPSMSAVLYALQESGAQIDADGAGNLPVKLHGAPLCVPILHRIPVRDESLKAALLLAGLNIAGTTTIIDPQPSSDHLEKMMVQFGALITVSPTKEGSRCISVEGQPDLQAQEIHIPGDPFLAGCLVVAGLIVPDASLTIKSVFLNSSQISFLETLVEMGADIEIVEHGVFAEQPVCDLLVRNSCLNGVDIPQERIHSIGEQYPLIAVAASNANGRITMAQPSDVITDGVKGMGDLANALQANGVSCALDDNTLTIVGTGSVPGGGAVKAGVDARIAMACLIMGMGSQEPVKIDDARLINRDHSQFLAFMRSFGANLV